jgi:hypothetical protein
MGHRRSAQGKPTDATGALRRFGTDRLKVLQSCMLNTLKLNYKTRGFGNVNISGNVIVLTIMLHF